MVVAGFLVVLILASSLFLAGLAASPPILRGVVKTVPAKGSLPRREVRIDLRVRLASLSLRPQQSPDCYPSRPGTILINGLFMPTISVQVNDTLIVNVFNELPPSLSQVSSGISIHWHGLYMWNEAGWMDGASYVTQCPISPGSNFTYRFLVNEQPGTYLWHDHATANRANGLQGTLIVRPPSSVPQPYGKIAGEHVLFLTDWHHQEGNSLAKMLNRPAIPNPADNTTGLYQPVPPPDSLLINGKGSYANCNTQRLMTNPVTGYRSPYCAPQNRSFQSSVSGVLPLPLGLNSSLGCPHEQILVSPGSSYYLRIINAATSTYLTVCFEGHTLNLVAADGTPMADGFTTSCIDLTNGQRYEAILTASPSPKARSYWVSVHAQYENAVASGYGMLTYLTSPTSNLSSWPLTAPPQPFTIPPWTMDQILQVNTHDALLGYLDDYTYESFWNLFLHLGSYGGAVLFYPPKVNITLNVTSPVMESSGLLRWTFNDIAMPVNPPCQPLMELILSDPNWIKRNTINASNLSSISKTPYRQQSLNASDTRTNVYLNGSPAPLVPLIGAHLAQVSFDDGVGIIINNLPPAGGNNYSMVHPIHFHGHKFWLLGAGKDGPYNSTRHKNFLNLYNPIIRDTILLAPFGWAVLRFKADNPGIWPLHCHNFWHMFMGQSVYVMEGDPNTTWPKAPSKGSMPRCPATCISNFASWKPSSG